MTNIKFIILALLLVGAGVLAYYVLGHLSDEVVMTLVGVMCGIIASIPISIGLLVLLTRDRSAHVSAPVQTMSSAEFWTIETPPTEQFTRFEYPDDPYLDAPTVHQLKP